MSRRRRRLLVFWLIPAPSLNDAWIFAAATQISSGMFFTLRVFIFPTVGLRWASTGWHGVAHVCTFSPRTNETVKIEGNPGALCLRALRLRRVCRITWPHKYLMRFLHTLLPLWLASCLLHSGVFPRGQMAPWNSYLKVQILRPYKVKGLIPV